MKTLKLKMMHNPDALLKLTDSLQEGDIKSLARCISIVENELEGYQQILRTLKFRKHCPVIGITGPPGGGKSTFINVLTKSLLGRYKKIAVLAIDPSSPFNLGALLGDRVRMAEHFTNPNVYIRSLATRGSLGGLSVKTLEVVDLVRAADFDCILVETVGVGQSEVEVAGLADTTILLMVPEGGDEIQALKSGIMEVADIFVVNKADRPGSEAFVNMVCKMLLHTKSEAWTRPVLKVVALQNEGLEAVVEAIELHAKEIPSSKKMRLLTEKAFQLIQYERMKDLDKNILFKKLEAASKAENFNMYAFVAGLSATNT